MEEGNKTAPEEMTITFVCNRYPRKLLKHITRVRGMKVKKMEEGIYYLTPHARTLGTTINETVQIIGY